MGYSICNLGYLMKYDVFVGTCRWYSKFTSIGKIRFVYNVDDNIEIRFKLKFKRTILNRKIAETDFIIQLYDNPPYGLSSI